MRGVMVQKLRPQRVALDVSRQAVVQGFQQQKPTPATAQRAFQFCRGQVIVRAIGVRRDRLAGVSKRSLQFAQSQFGYTIVRNMMRRSSGR